MHLRLRVEFATKKIKTQFHKNHAYLLIAKNCRLAISDQQSPYYYIVLICFVCHF